MPGRRTRRYHRNLRVADGTGLCRLMVDALFSAESRGSQVISTEVDEAASSRLERGRSVISGHLVAVWMQ
jgi:hypothetical protein